MLEHAGPACSTLPPPSAAAGNHCPLLPYTSCSVPPTPSGGTHCSWLLHSPSPFPSPAGTLPLPLRHRSRGLGVDITERLCIMLSRGQPEERGTLQSWPGECVVPHPGSHPPRPSIPHSWPGFVQRRPRWIVLPATGSKPLRLPAPLVIPYACRGGFCKHKHTSRAASGGLGKERWMLLLFPGSSSGRGSPRPSRRAPSAAGSRSPAPLLRAARIPGAGMERGGHRAGSRGHSGTLRARARAGI